MRIGRFVPEGAKIRFGDLVFSQESLLTAMPAPEFFLLHDGWRVAPFRWFRPVVYTCAFGPSPDADLLDWCLARYRIESCEAFSGAAPLLYHDADIMCDRPLTGLLAQLRMSDRVNATPEGRLGEGGRETDGRWFGWRLLEADGVAFDPDAPGFSAGALGVPAQDFARAAYRCILDGTYGHADQTGRRLPPFDQAMARYVLRKSGLLGLDVMPRYLRLCRVDGPHRCRRRRRGRSGWCILPAAILRSNFRPCGRMRGISGSWSRK